MTKSTLAAAVGRVQKSDKVQFKQKRNSVQDLARVDSPTADEMDQPDIEHQPRHQYHTKNLKTNRVANASLASRNSQVSQTSRHSQHAEYFNDNFASQINLNNMQS